MDKYTHRIKYFTEGEWFYTGLMREKDAKKMLPAYLKEYKEAEVITDSYYLP